MNKEEVLELCEEEQVKFVDLQFTDLSGVLKAVTIPVSQLEEAIDNNVWFDGSSIEGFVRICESDMYLKPDLNTFAIVPWSKVNGHTTARLICNVYTADGQLFEGSPRNILIRQLERAREMGFEYMVGPEFEFFLFEKSDSDLNPLPHDRGGYFDQTMDKAAEIRKEITDTLQAFGIVVEALHHEVAIGQHEIDFRYGDALAVADHSITLKYVVKAVANRNNLHATFMPKPISGINGSGMHVHQSLFRDGKNAFYDPNHPLHLSETARHFIAGQLNHIKAMVAITNPTVNSYKRLLPGYEAPVYITWGRVNRSALIRVPEISPGREKSTRCELRCPDPSSNPYLVFAVMLAAGLDGIEKKMELQEPFEEDLFSLEEADLALREIDTLPENIYVALRKLAKDEVIRSVLGDNTFNKYFELKKREWEEYNTQITRWELSHYLYKY